MSSDPFYPGKLFCWIQNWFIPGIRWSKKKLFFSIDQEFRIAYEFYGFSAKSTQTRGYIISAFLLIAGYEISGFC